MSARPVIALLIAMALTAGSAAAQPPLARSTPPAPAVGLVLEVRGTTDPALKPFREIRAGETIRLRSAARLVVLDYQPRGIGCRTMTLEGGVVTFKLNAEPVLDGGVATTRDTQCPRRLPTTQAAGGVVQRSAIPRLSVPPAFMISGAAGDQVATVRTLSTDRKVILETPVRDQQFTWPADAPALPPNDRYVFELVSRDGRTVLGSREFFVSAADANTPTVLIVE